MKKFLTLLMAALMLLMIVPIANAEETTITFAFWDTNQEPGMRAIADAYEAAHPGVKIVTQVTPWSEYWTKLEAAAMGGEMPDVYWMHSNQFFKYADAGIMLDLSDLDIDYSVYPEGITALYNFDGTQLAVPKDYDTIALVYNKEIFDAAGEPYPDDTWTWDTLREVAKRLTDTEKGIYGFGAPNDTQSGYDLDATKEAIQAWADLMLVDGVSPSLESFVDMGVDDQFRAGKLAMCFTGSWNMSAYTANEVINGKFDLCVLPKGKVRASIYNGLGYAGSANTKYPEVVKDFIKYCGSEEANILQAQNKAAIPAYAGTEHYFTDLFTDINISCYTEMIEYGVQFPFSPNKSLWEGTETELMTSAYTGAITFAEACDQLHAAIMEIEG